MDGPRGHEDGITCLNRRFDAINYNHATTLRDEDNFFEFVIMKEKTSAGSKFSLSKSDMLGAAVSAVKKHFESRVLGDVDEFNFLTRNNRHDRLLSARAASGDVVGCVP